MSLNSSGGVSPGILRQIWSVLVHQLSLNLVEAYSRARKCTPEGRGLMTLDLSQLRAGLEKLSALKPLPHWEIVLQYVNAFYLQESELLLWVSSHPSYTAAQLQAVAECGSAGASKGKKERLALVSQVTQAHQEAVAKARATKEAKGKSAITGKATTAAAAAPPAAASASVPALTSAAAISAGMPPPHSNPNSRPGSKQTSRAGSRANSRPATPPPKVQEAGETTAHATGQEHALP
jgi:hypothetical protein